MLQQYFPEAQIKGDIYPADPFYVQLQALFGYIFVIGIIIMFAGDFIKQAINIPMGKQN